MPIGGSKFPAPCETSQIIGWCTYVLQAVFPAYDGICLEGKRFERDPLRAVGCVLETRPIGWYQNDGIWRSVGAYILEKGVQMYTFGRISRQCTCFPIVGPGYEAPRGEKNDECNDVDTVGRDAQEPGNEVFNAALGQACCNA